MLEARAVEPSPVFPGQRRIKIIRVRTSPFTVNTLRLTTVAITLLALLPAPGWAEAIFMTRAPLRIASAPQDTLLQRGIAALQEGDVRTALATLEQAVVMTPSLVEPHFWLGLARLEAGQPAAAVASLQRAEDLIGAFDRRISYQLGVALMRNGDLAGARARFEAVIEADPTSPLPKLNLGWILMQEDQGAEALGFFEAVISEHPDNDLAHYYAGRIHEGNARFAEAVGAYERALHVSPDMAQALIALGKLEMARGHLGAARGHFEHAVKRHPQVIDAHLQLGLLEVREGNLDAGINELERAVTLDPANEAARYNLGIAYARAGRRAESQLALDQFDVTRTTAVELERAGRRSRAESRAESLLRAAQRDVEAGNWEGAHVALVESVDLDPTNPEALKLLSATCRERARVFLAEGSSTRAVEVLEAAVGLWATEVATWELLVEAYRAVGDVAGAERAMERVRALR